VLHRTESGCWEVGTRLHAYEY